MSIHLRSPASPPVNSLPSPHDLKQRVIACLNKLADRDTLALASAELDSIARNLTHDSFSLFLNCIHNTDSSCKSPVRKHCVALLSLLSRSHGDSLSPHLSKMVSTVIRRLRDPDSSVRAACAAAAADMSAHVTRQTYAGVAKPLMDTLIQEGDSNAQIGAAMCLAAAVEAAADPEAEQLRKALPRMGKLLKSDGFKAKAALLAAVGSVIGAGGAGTKAVLDWLVPSLTEFLSSEDWAARKSAAEALVRVATAEEELAPFYKKACTAALESRRFDKVKIVRETMNRALELWKEVQSDTDEASSCPSPSPSRSSTDDGSIGCFSSVTRSSSTEVGFKTPRPKKATPRMKRSPSLPMNKANAATGQKENLARTNQGNMNSLAVSKVDNNGPPSLSPTQSLDHGTLASEEKGAVSDKIHGSWSGSRVVPCNDNDKNEKDENKKDGEELSLIREQLAQIENQQSNLLALIQKFIGSSQSGIQSLESRVSGLEMALDEISFDVAISSGRIPKSNCSGEACCKLPGSEFLSPKFWRKPEARLHCSKLSSSSSVQTQTVNTVCKVTGYQTNDDQTKPEPTDGSRGSSGFQNRSSKSHFQDSLLTTLQNPTTRLST
ncbi:PREDICTED: microtubule-associated protein TORTIFOLIA1 [Tarenaya hassleriana]|uniref:microtubule-associated protein TORTIFOLIA1 n=1 Tax=Tarenaya hassleriana TaxID=28532 RepID=UPI00053C26E4|nr:PREDICTED: microtubule-associated protein TORTIFOLIA1 [Tarenaya hassleriana]